jgi:hypothetical protein
MKRITGSTLAELLAKHLPDAAALLTPRGIDALAEHMNRAAEDAEARVKLLAKLQGSRSLERLRDKRLHAVLRLASASWPEGSIPGDACRRAAADLATLADAVARSQAGSRKAASPSRDYRTVYAGLRLVLAQYLTPLGPRPATLARLVTELAPKLGAPALEERAVANELTRARAGPRP